MKQEHLSRRRFLCSAAALAGGLSLFGPSAVFASPGMTCAESLRLKCSFAASAEIFVYHFTSEALDYTDIGYSRFLAR